MMLYEFKLLVLSITNALIWIFLFVGVVVLMSFLKDSRSKNKKIIFFGDSITKSGVERGGYISLIKNLLRQQGINNYDLMAEGIGGNKVYDLYVRMNKDIIAQSPDIVVLWIGVNDLRYKSNDEIERNAADFEKFYREIVNRLQADEIKIILVTPAVIGEKYDHTNPQDDGLDNYTQIIRTIAKDVEVALCDLHSIFHLYEVNNNTANADKGILTTDGVHLNNAGNKLVADEMWKVFKDNSIIKSVN